MAKQRTYRRPKIYFEPDTTLTSVDYKDLNVFEKYVNEHGKIMPSRITKTDPKVQRQLSTAVKRARYLALIPYTENHKI